jgi:hypothetical protein
MPAVVSGGRVAETDQNLLAFKFPDDVTSPGTVEVLVRAGVATIGIAGIIISIATLINALLH